MEMCLDEKWKLSSSSSKKGSRRSAAVAPAATSEAGPRGLNKGRTSSTGPAARSAVPGRLASLVKEQRARFYIVRRCVTMLVCWRD